MRQVICSGLLQCVSTEVVLLMLITLGILVKSKLYCLYKVLQAFPTFPTWILSLCPQYPSTTYSSRHSNLPPSLGPLYLRFPVAWWG